MKYLRMLVASALLAGAAACTRTDDDSAAELARLRQAVQEQTEQMMAIHLDLASAAGELQRAEQQARAGSCVVAAYRATDALDYLLKADDALLELGRSTQQRFGLDTSQ